MTRKIKTVMAGGLIAVAAAYVPFQFVAAHSSSKAKPTRVDAPRGPLKVDESGRHVEVPR